MARQIRKFQAISIQSFSFFEESLKRTLLIKEGYPRLNARHSSDNVLHSLQTLTERNHAFFIGHYLVEFISLIIENCNEVDASMLYACL